MSSTTELSAEERFRQAFERLKSGKPTTLPAGTPVSQNNVAKEAGCDPSALRKTRFPSLIREIQAFVELTRDEAPSKRQLAKQERGARQEERERLAQVARQRDAAVSQLGSANRRIVELTEEVRLLRLRLEELQPAPKPLIRTR